MVAIDSILFQSGIAAVSSDIRNNVIIGLDDGRIIEVDPELEITKSFKIPDFGSISFIDARNSLRPFFFSQRQQEFLFLERFLSESQRYVTRDFTPSLVQSVAIGQDNSIWMLESEDLILKKFDLTTRNLLLTVPLGRMHAMNTVHKMQSYKNSILISGQNKIWHFDGYGNLIYSLATPSVSEFSISRNTLYAVTDQELILIDLNNKKREVREGPPNFNCVINVGKRILFLGKKNVVVYEDLR